MRSPSGTRPSTLRRSWILLVAICLLAAFSPGMSTARAIDHSKGHPGFCRDSTGVTVVIDFQQLGGSTIVRCNPQNSAGTGLDALINAGIQVEGVQRWGLAFICRIENRPSAVESIPIAGNSGYQERCIDTPPAAGYWSYWHAGNNCSWDYSQWGVKNRNFIRGGFEGWSFSLNATADANPIPRIAPVRPGTEGQRCTTPDEPGPSSNDPNETLPPTRPGTTSGFPADPGGTGGATGSTDLGDPSDGTGSSGATGTGGTVRPGGTSDGSADGNDATRGERAASGPGARRADAEDRSDGPSRNGPREPDGSSSVASGATDRSGTAGVPGVDPEANATFSGGEDAPDARDVIRRQSDASSVAPWIALGGIIVLGGAAGWIEGRRRRRRDAVT